MRIRQHTYAAYVCAYVSIVLAYVCAYVSIVLAYVSIRMRIRQHTYAAYVSIRQHTYADYAEGSRTSGTEQSQHTLAYGSIRQHVSAYVSVRPSSRPA
jgi:hypothetical protein